MKAVGASSVNINTIFVTEAGVIGFLGGIIGIILGAGINKIIQVLLSNFMTSSGLTETISFGTPAWLTWGTLIFSMTIAILAGLYPANRASKMDPVEALAAR
jgi:putative ABC transport system permease protein